MNAATLEIKRESGARCRERNQAYIHAAKAHPCMDCGLRYPPYVMDFDHRDPTTKHRQVSEMSTWSLESIQTEIDKCDLVCANCHRERTWA